MRLTVNDESLDLPDGATVTRLLEHLDLLGKFVAVERNRHVVPYTTFGETVLADGDRLEIVTLVGGG